MNYSGSNQTNINPEILHLMKSGGLPFLNDYIKELQQPDYPMDFVAFMDQMITESGMDRKTVIARSGLSESLAYKYLNGNKKTTERDYILAFCIALHLTFPQTQHALRCCGLPLLGNFDLRAIIIRWGLEQRLDRYQIDEHLENRGLPQIRISSDMPSAEIKDSYSGPGIPQMEEPNSPAYQPVQYADNDEYEIIDSSAKATHCGNAPFDFNYLGSMTLRDTAGKTYHLEAIYLVTGETFFYVMDDDQYEIYKESRAELEAFDSGKIDIPCPSPEEDMETLKAMLKDMEEKSMDEDEEDNECECMLEFLECYDSLLAATASSFFPYFMELDHLTDKKVAEVLNDINDTRNYPYRCGAHWAGGNKPEIYIEMFNSTEPERREYYQMIETIDHECTYTASHESYFMQTEMGNLYDLYFTKRREPEYFLHATDQDFKKLDKRYQMIFNNLRYCLHSFARSNDTFVKIPDEQFYEEETEFFAEMFVVSMHSNNIEQAKLALTEQERAINARKIPEAEKLTLLTILDMRKQDIAESTGSKEEAEQIREAIISRKKKALKLKAKLGKDSSTVLSVIANALLDKWRALQSQGIETHTRKCLEEILELMDYGAFSDENSYAPERFEVFQAYAFQLDEKEPEKAEEYYLKALKEATKHHLDMQPRSAAAVAATYNNYAWVLWNKFGSEEAIINYGRAIELTETYLENGMLTPEHARKNLAHYGVALLVIYRDTGRKKEHDRLLDRLIKNGVTFKEE